MDETLWLRNVYVYACDETFRYSRAPGLFHVSHMGYYVYIYIYT